MPEEDPVQLKKDLKDARKRLDALERELRLLADGPRERPAGSLMEVEGGFFEVMKALKALYPEKAEDKKLIYKISKDIEKGRIKLDMTDLFFRFFIRQEINNARIKLLLLTQKLPINADLFDQLDDMAVLIDDPRYSVHQVILGWKRFERDVSREINRLKANK